MTFGSRKFVASGMAPAAIVALQLAAVPPSLPVPVGFIVLPLEDPLDEPHGEPPDEPAAPARALAVRGTARRGRRAAFVVRAQELRWSLARTSARQSKASAERPGADPRNNPSIHRASPCPPAGRRLAGSHRTARDNGPSSPRRRFTFLMSLLLEPSRAPGATRS